MDISIHFIASLILSIILFPFFGFYSFLSIVGGFLIDFDHYIDYVISHRDLSLKRAYWFHKEKKDTKTFRLDIFHTIEFLIFMFILSFYSKLILIVFIGVVLHMLMDLYNPVKSDMMPRSFSIIYWIIKRYL